MANALWLSPYYSDLATITIGGGVASGFPASNMQLLRTVKVCRTAGVGSQTINIDLGASGAIAATACALLTPRSGTGSLGSGATWIIGASNSSLAAAVSSPSLLAVNGASIWIGSKPTSPWIRTAAGFATWANVTAYRYWAVTVLDGAGASYYELIRIMLGAAFQPSVTVDQTIGVGFFSTDGVQRTPHNQLLTERRGPVGRHWNITYQAIDQAQARTGAMQLARQCGAGGDLFFALDPADTAGFADYSMQAVFAPLPQCDGAPLFDDSAGKQCWAYRCGLDEVL